MENVPLHNGIFNKLRNPKLSTQPKSRQLSRPFMVPWGMTSQILGGFPLSCTCAFALIAVHSCRNGRTAMPVFLLPGVPVPSAEAERRFLAPERLAAHCPFVPGCAVVPAVSWGHFLPKIWGLNPFLLSYPKAICKKRVETVDFYPLPSSKFLPYETKPWFKNKKNND